MSGPAWTTPKARPEAEAVQEAPYLTHLTRHHGQFTLTAPPNMGRRHSEEPPASEPEAKAKQRRKLKQRKRGIDPSIVSAVVNAGVSASPAPGRATASRPAWASSALPAPMDRVASGSGAPHPRQRAQRSQSENGTQLNPPSPSGGPDGRSRSYARTDVWEGLDVGEDGPPAFSQPQPPPVTVVPPSPAPVVPSPRSRLPVPSSPPPEYPFPTAPLPIDALAPLPPAALMSGAFPHPHDDDEEDEEDDEDDFVFSENDPLVLAWEADRAAGLDLDERIARDLERRVLTDALVAPPPSPLLISLLEELRLSTEGGLEQDALNAQELAMEEERENERLRIERRELEIAERERDAPRIARALSVHAGRRFAAAAERRIAGRRRSVLGRPDSQGSPKATTNPSSLSTASSLPSASTLPPPILPAQIDEEVSESDGEESPPAVVARAPSAHAKHRFAEAAERRMALERAAAVLVPTVVEDDKLVEPAPESAVPAPSTLALLFPPKPFGTTNRSVSAPSIHDRAPVETRIASRQAPLMAAPSRPPPSSSIARRPSLSSPPSRETLAPLALPASASRDYTPPLPVRSSLDGYDLDNLLAAYDAASAPSSRQGSLDGLSQPTSSVSLPRTRPHPPPSRTVNPPRPALPRPSTSVPDSTAPPTPGPSFISYISPQERQALPAPLLPTPSPSTTADGDPFAGVRLLRARFEGTTNRRPAPLPPTTRHLPIANRFIRPPVAPTPPAALQPPLMRKPLPVPPAPADFLDAYTELRMQQGAGTAAGGSGSTWTRPSSADEPPVITREPPTPSTSSVPLDDMPLAPPRPSLFSGMQSSSPSSSFLASPPLSSVSPTPERTPQAPGTSDFAYTDLDVLLSRLEDQESASTNYDELIMLGEVLGPARPVGASLSDIETLGVARVELERKRIDKQGRTKTKLSVVGLRCMDCSICILRFRPDDFAVVLPRCLHIFHAECIRRWLAQSKQCPLCRIDVFEPKNIEL